MPRELIELIFDGDNVTIKTSGFTGAACLKATEDLENDLGVKRADTKTGEYRQTVAAKVATKR